MPEKPPNFEDSAPEERVEHRFDRQELLELRNKAIEFLRRDREQGELKVETQDALMAWRLAAEQNLVELYSQEPFGVIQVRVTIEQAAILREGGWHQEASDALYDTQTQARAENRRDLFEAAGDAIDQLNQSE